MVQVPRIYEMVKQFLDMTRSHILLHCMHYSPVNACNFGTTVTIFGAFYENSYSWSHISLRKTELNFSNEKKPSSYSGYYKQFQNVDSHKANNTDGLQKAPKSILNLIFSQ